MKISWKKYFEVRCAKNERELLTEALPYVTCRGIALDLGAGSMNDSKYLLTQNFKHVIAMDSDDEAAIYAHEITSDRFEFVKETFHNFFFQENLYDLINAQYALPFIPQNDFDTLIPRVVLSLKSGGVFCGQLFGVCDSWNVEGHEMSFHTENEIRNIFKNFKIIKLLEDKKDGLTALGKEKHWHIFHIIAVKM